MLPQLTKSALTVGTAAGRSPSVSRKRRRGPCDDCDEDGWTRSRSVRAGCWERALLSHRTTPSCGVGGGDGAGGGVRERGGGRERGLEGGWRGGERAHMGGMCDVRAPEPVPGREGRRWALPCPCRPWPQRRPGGGGLTHQ